MLKSIVIREGQIKITMRYHFMNARMAIIGEKMRQITSAGEDVDKLEPSYTAGRNIQWYSHCQK